ncbi:MULTISPECIES: aldehyde dehydrogenase (NADP(+)) [Actinomycetes]|uniref:Aldehyde dehydrogenase (NADP(+)) n=2 Tax=Actinomycetes TaxID=1760 RepID=A0ABP6LVZ6_9MICC
MNGPDTVLHSLIAGAPLPGEAEQIRATDPALGRPTGPHFTALTPDQGSLAVEAAQQAFGPYRRVSPAARAGFLRGIAEGLEGHAEQIVAAAKTETGLPQTRLTGELARTANQLRLFSEVVTEGTHHGVRIEHALPQRTPLPRPDIRQRRVPVGPVLVFGASNFPLAFSVAGGDTASALAAGAPVVFKAHNAHPLTSYLVGLVITEAAALHHLPAGVFSLVYGRGADIGQALIRHPGIRAVGFTGSRSGGTALMAAAAARPCPIPVFAEMSSVNPIILLNSALTEDPAGLAQGFVTSLTGSSGQLCTAPGLLFVPSGEAGDAFLQEVAERLGGVAGTTMLTPGICASRVEREQALAQVEGVRPVGRGQDGLTENAPAPAVYATDADTYLCTPQLSEEIFGSVCLVVRWDRPDQLRQVVDELEGQLTASLHFAENGGEDVALASDLVGRLEEVVGRILVGGWPTGVDVGDAIVHGGPFPATSDGRSTSVGATAIERWLRPVAYQDVPDWLQPVEVRDGNPLGIRARRVDGRTGR